MSENNPARTSTDHALSRRRFLASALLPAGALLVPGCTALTGGLQAGPSEQPGRHALQRLWFPESDRVLASSAYRSRQIPVQFGETDTNWHTKGEQPYLFSPAGEQSPPGGLRSAVPLGGLGAGTLELRGDGRLSNWMLFNNMPGGSPRMPINEAFWGLKVQSASRPTHTCILQTHPPEGYPGVESIAYSGTFPISRLQYFDDRIPLEVSLFAYSPFHFRDATKAHTPAALFTFVLSNPLEEAISVSLMYNQPNAIEGTFRSRDGFSLSRTGTDAASGELAIQIMGGTSQSSMVAQDLSAIWETFERYGSFGSETNMGIHDHGAVATSFVMNPGTTRSLTFLMGWYFPYRKLGQETVGNYYTNRYQNVREVNQDVENRLGEIWDQLSQWQKITRDTGMPASLEQAMCNSLGTLYRNGFWAQDGRWRQWDSFSVADISSINTALHKSLPLHYFYPELAQSLLRGYAGQQSSNGKLPANLGNATRQGLDQPTGEPVAEAAGSLALLSVLHYRYTGDEDLLREIWPNLYKGLRWQIDQAGELGLPRYLNTAYRWLGHPDKVATAYGSIVHLAGLKAGSFIAGLLQDTEAEVFLNEAGTRADTAMERLFWASDHFRAWWDQDDKTTPPVQSDTLFGMIWPLLLDLGSVVNETRAIQHLDVERKQNLSDRGLQIQPSSLHPPRPAGPVMPASAISRTLQALLLGQSISSSFDLSSALFEHIQQNLKDSWNVFAGYSADTGLPATTPHDSRHMLLWAIPLALSGQKYDAATKSLSFVPRQETANRFPFFTSSAAGYIVFERRNPASLHVVSGVLELNDLSFGNQLSYKDIYLVEGQSMGL